jgi:hypothetical protein
MLAVVIILAGCRTRPLAELQPVQVPAGLTQEQVELAILMALTDRYRPPDYPPDHRLTDAEVSNLLPAVAARDPYYDPRGLSPLWRYSARGPNSVEATYRQDQHFLVVDLLYDTRQITPRVVDSRYLRQTDERIHKAVFVWIKELTDGIESAMLRLPRSGQ